MSQIPGHQSTCVEKRCGLSSQMNVDDILLGRTFIKLYCNFIFFCLVVCQQPRTIRSIVFFRDNFLLITIFVSIPKPNIESHFVVVLIIYICRIAVVLAIFAHIHSVYIAKFANYMAYLSYVSHLFYYSFLCSTSSLTRILFLFFFDQKDKCFFFSSYFQFTIFYCLLHLIWIALQIKKKKKLENVTRTCNIPRPRSLWLSEHSNKSIETNRMIDNNKIIFDISSNEWTRRRRAQIEYDTQVECLGIFSFFNASEQNKLFLVFFFFVLDEREKKIAILCANNKIYITYLECSNRKPRHAPSIELQLFFFLLFSLYFVFICLLLSPGRVYDV